MGNRGGPLHDDDRQIVRSYKTKRWITCLLEFHGRRRVVMSPNRYTELFFLDEAVALAAGHRPCAECRHQRFNAFKRAWQVGHGLRREPSADEMDFDLHRARIDKRRKVTYKAPAASLPSGCFVEIGESPYLVLPDSLLSWTPSGYTRRCKMPAETVNVLTPQPIVKCLQAGYSPEIHETARLFEHSFSLK